MRKWVGEIVSQYRSFRSQTSYLRSSNSLKDNSVVTIYTSTGLKMMLIRHSADLFAD